MATFTQVGYGDIKGSTDAEYEYQMIVILIGIALYGYTLGTFQTIISQFAIRDQGKQMIDNLNMWLIQLDKKRKKLLPKSIFVQVRNFYQAKFNYQSTEVLQTTFFKQLKPRIQNKVMDEIFGKFYVIFAELFEGTELKFQRELLACSKLNYYSLNNPKDDLNLPTIIDTLLPSIEHAEKMSSCVHFIIRGQVHIMDKNCLYHYGLLEVGSYFGDISVLQGTPNQFSFCYNVDEKESELIDKSLYLLSVPAKDFAHICDKHPTAKEVMERKSLKRQEHFDQYKRITLIKYMKALVKTKKDLTTRKNKWD